MTMNSCMVSSDVNLTQHVDHAVGFGWVFYLFGICHGFQSAGNNPDVKVCTRDKGVTVYLEWPRLVTMYMQVGCLYQLDMLVGT